MSPLTLYLAKFFGLACLLMCGALAARPKASIAAIQSMTDNPGLLLLTGVMTLIAGAAAVVGHNVWSGGVLPVVVTLLAWSALLKGLALLVMTPQDLRRLYRALHYPQIFRGMMLVAAAASAALTWAAFSASAA